LFGPKEQKCRGTHWGEEIKWTWSEKVDRKCNVELNRQKIESKTNGFVQTKLWRRMEVGKGEGRSRGKGPKRPNVPSKEHPVPSVGGAAAFEGRRKKN